MPCHFKINHIYSIGFTGGSSFCYNNFVDECLLLFRDPIEILSNLLLATFTPSYKNKTIKIERSFDNLFICNILNFIFFVREGKWSNSNLVLCGFTCKTCLSMSS